MSLPWIYPEYVDVLGLKLSQTLITSFIWLALFLLFVFLNRFLKRYNPNNGFVIFVELFIENVINFFKDLAGGIPKYAQVYIIFLFVYIFWNNLIWVFWDMFANENVIPQLHHIFRPVSSDIYFNAILAIVGVVWALWYWFRKNRIHFIEKYFPVKGMWIVEEVRWPLTFLLKIWDIFIALFVGLLEFVWEFIKILSLTLRLFWNILAGMVLLWLVIWATVAVLKVPLLGPILIFVVELFVGFLQALVFWLLVLVYFKLAESTH